MSDLVIILNQRRAIEAFTKGGNLTLGGNLTVAVGPVGRSARLCFRGFYWVNYKQSLIFHSPKRCNASKPVEYLLAKMKSNRKRTIALLYVSCLCGCKLVLIYEICFEWYLLKAQKQNLTCWLEQSLPEGGTPSSGASLLMWNMHGSLKAKRDCFVYFLRLEENKWGSTQKSILFKKYFSSQTVSWVRHVAFFQGFIPVSSFRATLENVKCNIAQSPSDLHFLIQRVIILVYRTSRLQVSGNIWLKPQVLLPSSGVLMPPVRQRGLTDQVVSLTELN